MHSLSICESLPADQRRLFVFRSAESPASSSWLSSLEDDVASLESLSASDVKALYVPHDAALIYCFASTARRLVDRHDVLFAGLIAHEMKTLPEPSDFQWNNDDTAPDRVVVPERFRLNVIHAAEGAKSLVEVVVHVAVHPSEPSVEEFVRNDIGEKLVAPGLFWQVQAVEELGFASLFVEAVSLPLKSLVGQISQLPRVVSVVVKAQRQMLNVVAASIVDHGYPDGDRNYDEVGLTGQGEVVAVGDTGIDYWACLFSNSSGGVSHPDKSRDRKNLTDSEKSKNDKILGYWEFMDGLWDSPAHGTHVSGTVAGNFNSELSAGLALYGGVALDSKILFADIQCDDLKGCTCGNDAAGRAIPCPCVPPIKCARSSLVTPTNLGADYLGQAVENNVWIHSNSWGSWSCLHGCYTAESQTLDSYLFKNPGLLAVFAVGNDAVERSISDLGHAKNVLSVGASGTTSAHIAAIRNGTWSIGASENSTVAEQSIDSWESLAFFSSMGPTMDGRIKPDVVAPGHRLGSALSYSSQSEENKCGSGLRGDFNNLTAHLVGMSGTSMATPTVSGYAALIRQYLRMYYPNFVGLTNGSTPIVDPPASLVKALIINSARTMVGLYSVADDAEAKNLRFLERDDPYPQGFGRVSLENILPLSASFGYKLTVLEAENFTMSSNSTNRMYTVNITESGLSELRVTLVWTDYESSLTGRSASIVSDLDLNVTVIGNNSAPQHYGNEQYFDQPDRKNNVERVIIENPEPGVYNLTVSAFALPRGPQSFSLVASYGVSTYVPPDIAKPSPSLMSSVSDSFVIHTWLFTVLASLLCVVL